ncbi:MAG TPA: Yip1 family protein [Steroidobacteraceae bacterium]|nr:Yip1 family protein [Steroidobacteraceae bacterium]
MELQEQLSLLLRCLLLDERAYTELRRAPHTTLPALIVVVVATLLGALGGLIWTFTAATSADHARFFLRSVVGGSILQVIFFALWTLIAALVLQRIYLVRATYGDLWRVMGYAFAPMALQLLIFVPALDQPIGLIALAITFYVTTYAIQSSTGATAGQAFTASLAGFAVFCLCLGVLGNGPRDLAPGIFALDPNGLSVGLTFPIRTVPR